MKNIRILLAGGGSRGHTVPALAVAREIKKLEPTAKLLFVGTRAQMERPLVEAAGVEYKYLKSNLRWRRYFSLANLWSILSVPYVWWEAEGIIGKFKPDVVFAKGGYNSVPLGWVAVRRRIPLVIHESDLTLGRANRFLAPWARLILTSFDHTRVAPKLAAKIRPVGNPIRESIGEGRAERARRRFNLPRSARVIFATAASSAARDFSGAIIGAAALLPKINFVYQCGQPNEKRCRQLIRQYELENHFRLAVKLSEEEMNDLYQVADLVICRGSSTTLFELAALGKPAIAIPLPRSASRGDQLDNVKYFVSRQAIISLGHHELSSGRLVENIQAILNNRDLSQSLSHNISRLHRPGVATEIAKTVLSVVK